MIELHTVVQCGVKTFLRCNLFLVYKYVSHVLNLQHRNSDFQASKYLGDNYMDALKNLVWV